MSIIYYYLLLGYVDTPQAVLNKSGLRVILKVFGKGASLIHDCILFYAAGLVMANGLVLSLKWYCSWNKEVNHTLEDAAVNSSRWQHLDDKAWQRMEKICLADCQTQSECYAMDY